MTALQHDDALDWQDRLPSFGLETGDPLLARVEIAAPRDAVWSKITTPGHLKHCHPFCQSTEVERWPGQGTRDSITYYSGRRYQRNFVDWFEGVGYDIELGDPPDQTCRVRWRIRDAGPEHSSLSIEVIPYLKAALPADKRQRYQDRLFGADLQHYLECVVAGVSYWITTGQDVTKDQFGANPLYSG